MAFSIANGMAHAVSFIKAVSTYASAEEVRFANTVESLIGSFYPWHWAITAGTDIAVTATTQDYSVAAGDSGKVFSITQANLLKSSVEQPELMIWADPILPKISTAGQPYAVSLLAVDKIRLFPNPDATYTFQWRYHKRPTIHATNTESFDVPEAFTDVVKAGMVWQLLSYADDDRAEYWGNKFNELLFNQKRFEQMTTGRRRT